MPITPEQYKAQLQEQMKAQTSEFSKQAEAARQQVGYHPSQAQLMRQTPSSVVQIQQAIQTARAPISQAYGEAMT